MSFKTYLVDSYSGVHFTLKTEKTMGYGGHGYPILAFWPTERHLNELDDLNDVPALFVVPWVLKQTEAWSMARSPRDLCAPLAAGQAQTRPVPVVANPVAEQALKDIAGSINMSTGLANPDDKKTVIDTFKILRAAGEHYSPAEVQAWLTQNGMSAKYAAEVAKVAADPSKFRSTRANSFSYLPANALELWREKARGNR